MEVENDVLATNDSTSLVIADNNIDRLKSVGFWNFKSFYEKIIVNINLCGDKKIVEHDVLATNDSISLVIADNNIDRLKSVGF